MLRVLRNARIPLFLCRKSNHIFTVWAAYGIIIGDDTPVPKERVIRMFSEWLVEEAYYLRTFLQLSHIPHFTTLQKFTERISGTLLEKVMSSFIILTKDRTTIRWNRFVWIQSNPCFSVLCRKSKAEEKKKKKKKIHH